MGPTLLVTAPAPITNAGIAPRANDLHPQYSLWGRRFPAAARLAGPISKDRAVNVISADKQISIVAAIPEGMSIRSTERLTGVHRDTIMRLGVRIGEGCAALHDRTMRNLQVGRAELD